MIYSCIFHFEFLAPAKNPLKILYNLGIFNKKLSCPLSESISTKLTLQALEARALTSNLLSEVGNNQSLVKEISSHLDGLFLNAYSSLPLNFSDKSYRQVAMS